MRKVIIISILIMGLISCRATNTLANETCYYLWAGLYTMPPTFSDPIPKEKALKLEEEGKAYYIVEYDEIGNIVNLEKRYQGKTFLKHKYYYTNGVISRVDVTNAEGVTTSQIIENK